MHWLSSRCYMSLSLLGTGASGSLQGGGHPLHRRIPAMPGVTLWIPQVSPKVGQPTTPEQSHFCSFSAQNLLRFCLNPLILKTRDWQQADTAPCTTNNGTMNREGLGKLKKLFQPSCNYRSEISCNYFKGNQDLRGLYAL